MWSASQSVARNQQWNGNPRNANQIICDLPALYYRDIDKPIVIDKCRAWTLPLNIQMVRDYVTPQPKVIVCVRAIDQIVKSFHKLFASNGRNDFESSPFANELSMSIAGVANAIEQDDSSTYLFVDYEQLCNNPEHMLAEIYNFLDLDAFTHDLNNIVNNHQEDDSVYGLVGMHNVRRSISRL
jgi:hypothetical protein